MSSFTADWLGLREPFDHAARSPAVARELGRARRGKGSLRVVDLGAGTGANLRYLAPRLGGEQHWLLIDHDSNLLAALPERLARWANAEGYQVVETRGDHLEVKGKGFVCSVEPRVTDMAGSPSTLPFAGAGLITGSALLDLVSDAWLAALLLACHDVGAAVLFALTYNGETTWRPADPDDARVLAFLNHHQRGDKGFGPALGPSASERLVGLLRTHGYCVVEGQSDWKVGREGSALQNALVDGWARAASEFSPDEARRIEGWRGRRLKLLGVAASEIAVGHRDVLAWLP